MQKISTHLWYDKEAKEAAYFYISVFDDADIRSQTTLHNTPSGDVDVLNIQLYGQDFTLISAGPLFKFNPSVSFLVACKSKEEVETLWGKLIKDGKALMELGEYPFNEKYGWLQDKYGLSWQLMFMGAQPFTQKITPTMMFVGDLAGKAEVAMNFYTSVFHNSKIDNIMRYGLNQAPEKEGSVMWAGFTLEGESFAAMDSANEHNFSFNEAISFVVNCDNQQEIDYYWAKLSADKKAEQCGWLKDKFGFSWQVVPTVMDKMLMDNDKEKIGRVTEAFLKMKKFNIAELEKAYEGVEVDK